MDKLGNLDDLMTELLQVHSAGACYSKSIFYLLAAAEARKDLVIGMWEEMQKVLDAEESLQMQMLDHVPVATANLVAEDILSCQRTREALTLSFYDAFEERFNEPFPGVGKPDELPAV